MPTDANAKLTDAPGVSEPTPEPLPAPRFLPAHAPSVHMTAEQILRESRAWPAMQPKREFRAIVPSFLKKWRYLQSQEGFRRSPIRTVLRLVAWRVRCLLRLPATIALERWNLRMFLPGQWRGIAKLAFVFRDRYEPELHSLEQLLSAGMTFVDAGSCYGIYALAASGIVGGAGRVIAFEPASRAFDILQKNIALNSLTNVFAYRLALAASAGNAVLYHHSNVGCDSLGKDSSFTESTEVVAMESLDNVLQRVPANQVDVIKMDVQGAEELVLRGAEKTLRAARPAIIFEVYPDGTIPLGLSPYGAWEFLASLGYKFFVPDSRGALRKVQRPPADRNVVALYQPTFKNIESSNSPSDEEVSREF